MDGVLSAVHSRMFPVFSNTDLKPALVTKDILAKNNPGQKAMSSEPGQQKTGRPEIEKIVFAQKNAHLSSKVFGLRGSL